MASPSPPQGKFLASSDKKTRDQAFKDLSVFLSNSSSSQNVLSDVEMAKLWKGIFYSFWMSDKPLVQQALASEMAELILTINSTTSSLAFLRGFWVTMVREWGGIDRLRLDKFYMLVRRFINASFRLLMRTEWDESVCQDYTSILTNPGGPLCPDDVRVPTSLIYHLSDVYLEELDKALANPPKIPVKPAPLDTVLAPFLRLAARTSAKTTYQRIQSALLEPLLSALDRTRSDEPPDSKRRRLYVPSYDTLLSNASMSNSTEEVPVSVAVLKISLLGCIFTTACEDSTKDSNRRRLYAFWRTFAPDESDSRVAS